jgi:hypothetical protein
MILTCEKCGRKQPLTEEEIVFFHPRFFCLSCGTNLPFNVPAKKLAELRRSNDPDRRLTDVGGPSAEETIRRVYHQKEETGAGGSSG